MRCSGGFLLLAAFLLYRDTSGVVWQGLVACLLHEVGHWLALWFRGIQISRIELTVIGARMKTVGMMSYAEELVCVAAGPCVNLVLAALSSAFWWGQTFAGVNLILAVFNLLPVGRLDGARMVRCIFCILFSDKITCRICDVLDFCFTSAFAIAGLRTAVVGRNVTLLIVCLWLSGRTAAEKICEIKAKRMERGLVR